MNYVFRCYVEKKPGFNLEARRLFRELREGLGISSLANIRVFDRYDIDQIDYPFYLSAKTSVLTTPFSDDLYEEALPPQDPQTTLLVAEPLSGQAHPRADSCARCVQLLSLGERPLVSHAKVYALTGALSAEELAVAKAHLIPAGLYREGAMDKPAALDAPAQEENCVPPAAPFAALPITVTTDDGTETWTLTFHRAPDGLTPYQALHIAGRSDPQSASLAACHREHLEGQVQEYYHPAFADCPLDSHVYVCAAPANGTQAAPAPEPFRAELPKGGLGAGVGVGDTTIRKVEAILHDPVLASQRGLIERFPVGSGCVLMPFGGKNQLTPAQVSATLLPLSAQSDRAYCSVLAHALHPELPAAESGDVGAVEAAARLVAAGCDPDGIVILPRDSAHPAPTFAAALSEAGQVLSPEFKAIRHPVYLFSAPSGDCAALTSMWKEFHALAREGTILSAWSVGAGGVAEGLMKMSFGNDIGFTLQNDAGDIDLFAPAYGALVAECSQPLDRPSARLLGKTTYTPMLELSDCFLSVDDLRAIWEDTLEDSYPTRASTGEKDSDMVDIFCTERSPLVAAEKFAQPRAVIPVFPGAVCARDTAAACRRAGIVPELVAVDGCTPEQLSQCIQTLAAAMGRSQMVILPGGAVGNDEPDGAAKLMAAFLRAPALVDAMHELLHSRDGLVLGLGNGFQALVRLGLLPFGELRPVTESSPVLTRNLIGRRQCRYVTTRVASLKSPWMLLSQLDDIHTIPVFHSEGRFLAPPELLSDLISNGQVATQYVDTAGIPSVDISVNPSGSTESIEGLFSPDGRVFGKMGHSEWSEQTGKNVPGFHHQPIFESGAHYFH